LKSNRITYHDVSAFSFQYLGQHKIRHTAKCHDFSGIYQNYLYWTIQIERKVSLERLLVKYSVGDIPRLLKHLELYTQRRDQMVKRLLIDCDLIINDMSIVFENTVELTCSNGLTLYCSKDYLEKMKICATKFRVSKNPIYLPFLDIFSTFDY
jgi:hypothetical protein